MFLFVEQTEHHTEIRKKEANHASEVKSMKSKMLENESQRMSLEREIMILKDKTEKTKREW